MDAAPAHPQPSILRVPTDLHLSGQAVISLAVHLCLCLSMSITLPISVWFMPNCLHYSSFSLQHLIICIPRPPFACPGACLGLKETFRGCFFPVQMLS